MLDRVNSMVLRSAVALCLLQIAGSAVTAQSAPPAATPAAATTEPQSVAVLDPLTPPKAPDQPLPAPGAPTAAAAPAVPPAEADPIVVQVRRLLETSLPSAGAAERTDRAGLQAFYAEAGGQPLWISGKGLSPRARAVLAELKRAGEYGLDPAAFDVSASVPEPASAEALARVELSLGQAVLAYARHARGGRVDPAAISRMIDMRPRVFEPKSLLQAIASTDDAGAYLRGLHPKHPGFERLRQALVAARAPTPAGPEPVAAPAALSAGPSIRLGQSHEQVVLVRRRLGLAADGDNAAVLDKDLAAALDEWQRAHGLRASGLIDAATRSAFNRQSAPPRPSASDTVQRIIVNMERWRWMPDDPGAFHVWDNVPEQITRVIHDGKAVLTEKIVVGKPNTPTPVFSADMRFVIFHPSWGVPEGIKSNELGPMLRRAGGGGGGWLFGGGDGASRVLARHGLRVSHNGREVNPDSVNWSAVDVRQFQFTQPPSGSNVLGIVKFRFPNRFDVYMHDTPERHLFASATRTFSHGCMRVQNPMRLAELLLAHDKGWSADKVRGFVAHAGTSEITLATPIPVHVTYFTATVDETGKLHQHADVYGMDGRVASALAGKPVQLASGRAPDADAEAAPARAKRDPRQKGQAATARGAAPFDPFSRLSAN